MPAFLEGLEVTEEGYLWMRECPEQEANPPILPVSKGLWLMLHPHCKTCDFRTIHPPPTGYLQKSPTLWQTITNSLNEIEQMKDVKPDKSLRISVNRLAKQQQARLDAEQVNEEQAYRDATLRTVRTLNTMRALFPLLVKIIRNEYMLNQDWQVNVCDSTGRAIGVETMQSLTTKKNHRKRRPVKMMAWLLGDYVFGTCRKAGVASITEKMWRILECFFPEAEIHSLGLLDRAAGEEEWAKVLPRIVNEQMARRVTPLPHRLFSHLPPEFQAQVHSIAEACDQEYLHVFHHGNEQVQRTRRLYQQAVDRLVDTLRTVVRKRYRGAEVRVYGSCLSNLSSKSSDADISVHLPAAAYLKADFASGRIPADVYEKEMKGHVYRLNALLSRQSHLGFVMQDCVTRARVPVIKGTYFQAGNPFSQSGSLDFDICLSNEIAVVNSALLSEYALVDERVKSYLLGIKAWARESGISSAADNRISSYTWVNLGIFYLQCIGFVPNLQCRELMALHDFRLDPASDWRHCVNDLDTGFIPWLAVAEKDIWKQPDEFKDTPVTLLLYGFFHFYARQFPRSLYAVSIREGEVKLPRATFEKSILPNMCIEDPFESYYSHCPHDLGRPANENGHKAIHEDLVYAENYLRLVLEGRQHDASHTFWWLISDSATPQVSYAPPVPVNGQMSVPPPVAQYGQTQSYYDGGVGSYAEQSIQQMPNGVGQNGGDHRMGNDDHPIQNGGEQHGRPKQRLSTKAKATGTHDGGRGKGRGRGGRGSPNRSAKNKSGGASKAGQQMPRSPPRGRASTKTNDQSIPTDGPNNDSPAKPRRSARKHGSSKLNDQNSSTNPSKGEQPKPRQTRRSGAYHGGRGRGRGGRGRGGGRGGRGQPQSKKERADNRESDTGAPLLNGVPEHLAVTLEAGKA